MKQEEILTLIDEKIKDVEKQRFVSFIDNDEYGLETAKKIIEMLDE